MLLSLTTRAGVGVAQKELKTDADFRKVSNSDTLEFQGKYYKFASIDRYVVSFEETNPPIRIDGFVERI